MSLSYSNYSGTDPTTHRFQIALDGNTKIYYVDDAINILKEYDEETTQDLVTDLVNDVVDELNLLNLGTNKLNNLDNDIISNDTPTNRYERRIFSAVKDQLSAREAKLYRAKYTIQVLPRGIPGQRDAYYIFAMAGSGKSTWASKFALAYKRENPNNNVYIFSRKTYDPVFDGVIPGLIRPILDRRFVRESENEDSIDQYKNSLVIFDDFQKITDPAVLNAVEHLKNGIYELGRQNNTDVLSVQHKGLGGYKTLTEFTESTGIVCFPKMNFGESRKVLEKFLCFNKEQISRVFNEEGKKQRWMCLIRPNIVITENYIKVID